jgi:hypothetical protein
MHQFLGVVDDGLTAAGLVARDAHRVDGHGLGRWNGDLLLQQATEHALFGGIEHQQVGHDADASRASASRLRSATYRVRGKSGGFPFGRT